MTGLKVVGEVKKVGKSRNFQPKLGKSRTFSTFKVGKSRNFISLFIIVLSNMVVPVVVFEANHLVPRKMFILHLRDYYSRTLYTLDDNQCDVCGLNLD